MGRCCKRARPACRPFRRRSARLRPFVCVGLAYFLIGVIVPALWLHFRGEKGEWTLTGIIWSLAGGALGAIGALGIILAFTFGGRPIYVMPLVFGGAPVVNAFLTIYLARRMKEIGPLFLGRADHRRPRRGHGAASLRRTKRRHCAFHDGSRRRNRRPRHAAPTTPPLNSVERGFGTWIGAIAGDRAGDCELGRVWPGAAQRPGRDASQPAAAADLRGPRVLRDCRHRAVFLSRRDGRRQHLSQPAARSGASAAGTFGALGALGIIMAFNFGGKPVFVMPLVFGGAPVINTLFSVTRQGTWRRDQLRSSGPG